MSKTISLREANQAFARCIREVEAGEEYVITRKGEPVARLVPVSGHRVLTPEQEAARARSSRAVWKRAGRSAPDRSTATRYMNANSERFSLDTNLLVYSIDGRPASGMSLRNRSSTRVRRDCWLTLQAVSEFYAVVTRRRSPPALTRRQTTG